MYESYYRLRGKPFQLNPDPAYYFNSRGHSRALAYLQYGLYQGEGFIVITGEIGAGKTTLVRSLIEQLDAGQITAAQIVSTQLDAGEVLRAVANAYGIPTKGNDKANLLASIEAFLMTLASTGKRALLIVDEAQNLTVNAIEELRMLSNFQLGTQGLLQSFLVGQPQLRRMMRLPEMEQLSQRVIASYHLGPMDRTETEAYIKHRLKLAGWANDPSLDKDVYDGIFQYSGGLPRQINTITNHLLLAGCLAEKHRLTGVDIDKVIEEVREDFADGPEVNTGSKRAADVKGRTATKPISKPDQVVVPQRESGLAKLEDRIRELERNLSDMSNAFEQRVNELSSSRERVLQQMDQTLSRMGELFQDLADEVRASKLEV
jgi:general secretion pathway protein A